MFKKFMLIPASADPDQPVVRRVLEVTATGAEVVVCDFVYQPLLEARSNDAAYEPLRKRIVEERLDAARRVAAALSAQGRNATALAFWDHPLDLAVARQVVELDIDCVALEPAAAGDGRFSHAHWRLVASCPVPVLLVKSDGAEPYRRIAAAVDPTHAHAKPAELDDAILLHARALREALGAELRVLHCNVPLSELGAIDAGVRLEEVEQALSDTRRQALEDLIAAAGLPPELVELRTGRPEAVLDDLARTGQVQLLVMGALSRGRIRDMLIGSTAERVIERSRADVLAIKPPGMSFARRA